MIGSERSGSRLARVLSIAAYPAMFAAMAAVVIVYWEPIWGLASDQEALRAWVDGYGVAAPAAFVAIQVLQVVIFVIPGEVPQVAAGYLFGIPLGIALTLAGAALGSAIGFLLSRALGRPFLHAIVSEARSRQVEELIASPRGVATLFLLYLIPGIPKDFLCYVAGIGPIRLGVYLLASTAGRLPGVAVSVVLGEALAERQWVAVGVALGVAVALFAAGYLLRRHLLDLLERFARRDQPGRGQAGRGDQVGGDQPGAGSGTAATPAGRSARRKPK